MDLTMPTQWTVTWPEITGVVLFVVVNIWIASGAYRKIVERLDRLDKRMDSVEKRNVAADHETALVKEEQANQRTTIAVMASQLKHNSEVLARIERGVDVLRENNLREKHP